MDQHNNTTQLKVIVLAGFVGAVTASSLFFMSGFGKSNQQNLLADSQKGNQTTNISTYVQSNITRAAEKALPTVVGVINLGRSQDTYDFSNTEPSQKGTGSGVIFEKNNGKARIVTNNHVIQNAEKIQVSLPNGKQVNAQLLGTDPISDLAVLEIPDQGINAVAEFGDSSVLKVGEPSIAIGNPLGLEFSRSVTSGVISSVRRQVKLEQGNLMELIQTDASINPGNSGGALVNGVGQIIGINTLKMLSQGVEGLGFAIPINDAKPIIQQIITNGKVERPLLGISTVDLSSIPQNYRQSQLKLPPNVSKGVVITEVMSGSGAAEAKLQRGDVIIKLDDKSVENGFDLQRYLFKTKVVGANVKITYYRNADLQVVTSTLSKRTK